MSSHYFLIFLVILNLWNLALTKPAEKDHPLTEVNNKRLNDLIKRALLGFRKVLISGDKKLKLDSHEPHVFKDNLLWHYDDDLGNDKIYTNTHGISFLHGLSSYTINDVSASMKDLDAEIRLNFDHLQSEGKYKFGGYLFGGIVPLRGNGPYEAKSRKVDAVICVNMSLIDSKIEVDQTSVSLELGNFTVKPLHFMNIPNHHAKSPVNEILHRFYKKHKKEVNERVNRILEELTTEAFEGKTMQEFFDLLHYLAKKAKQEDDDDKDDSNSAGVDQKLVNDF